MDYKGKVLRFLSQSIYLQINLTDHLKDSYTRNRTYSNDKNNQSPSHNVIYVLLKLNLKIVDLVSNQFL